MRTNDYYKKRLIVRVTFWTTVSVGFVWLASASIMSWDNYECENKQVVVEPFDSLWSIADNNCTGSIESAVDDLVDEYGYTIQTGQTIQLTSKP